MTFLCFFTLWIIKVKTIFDSYIHLTMSINLINLCDLLILSYIKLINTIVLICFIKWFFSIFYIQRSSINECNIYIFKLHTTGCRNQSYYFLHFIIWQNHWYVAVPYVCKKLTNQEPRKFRTASNSMWYGNGPHSSWMWIMITFFCFFLQINIKYIIC